MTRRPVTWRRTLRAVAVAVALMLAVMFVGGNFVLVEIRLLSFDLETRLAWVALVAGALGFAAGLLYARARRGPARAREGDG